jgi:hypothetical protein
VCVCVCVCVVCEFVQIKIKESRQDVLWRSKIQVTFVSLAHSLSDDARREEEEEEEWK